MRSRSWHYHWWYSIIACIMTSNLVACRSVEDTQTPNIEYRAYGKKWSYFTVEHYKREWSFDSAFRFFGLREGIAQDVYLITEANEKIDVSSRIVALQKDGSYAPVRCCESMRTRAKIYAFDNKLILTFEQTGENTTDCFIHPPNQPDDNSRPPEKRIRYAILFGEFDMQAKLFRMSDFFAGGISDEDKNTALIVNATLEQVDSFFYSKRKPFSCDKKQR